MRVTDLAKRAEVGAHTIRYYVREGLIAPRRNPSNNYKEFGEQDVRRLRFIRGIQALGFSLGEVRTFLAKVDRRECPCSAIQAQLADKILAVQGEIEALNRRLRVMQNVHDGWTDDVSRPDSVAGLCRHLESQAAASLSQFNGTSNRQALGSFPKPRQPAAEPRDQASAERPSSIRRARSQARPSDDGLVTSALLQSGWRAAVPADGAE